MDNGFGGLAVNVAAMTDRVNQDCLVCLDKVIQNAIIAYTEFEQAPELLCKGFVAYAFRIFFKPGETFHQTPANFGIEPFQVAFRVVGEDNPIHRVILL